MIVVGLSLAQAPPANRPAVPAAGGAPAGPIAVIDVTYILEHYAKLKTAMEVYKADAQKVEDALKKERDGIAKRAEGIKAFQPGSPEYKKLEEELTKAESDWKLNVASKRRDFAEKESKYYLYAYQELTAAVKAYSERNGIQLVLRFNGAPIDPNNREMVQMEVFKMVMYYDKSIDITDIILKEMNRTAGVATRPAQPGQAPVRRQ
jgi:Skp family chaperone for outer membrane proteins